MRSAVVSIAVAMTIGAVADVIELAPRATSSIEPCAVIQSQWLNAAVGTTVKYNPSDALACLNSVPLDVTRDVELLDFMLPFIQTHSTVAFLKTPTPDYLMPAVDLLGGIAAMRQMLLNGTYKTQYAFTTDLYYLILRAKDGHLSYRPALNQIFQFTVPFKALSISTDGVSLPKIYIEDDVFKTLAGAKYTMSNIVSINGIEVVNWAESLTFYSRSQDPDAIYNQLFWGPGSARSGLGGKWQKNWWADAPNSLFVVFSNGSNATWSVSASSSSSFKNVYSGQTLHSGYEVTPTTNTNKNGNENDKREEIPGLVKRDITDAAAAALYTYPSNFIEKHYNDYIAGYYLPGSQYQDTAVLAIYSFAGNSTDNNSSSTGSNRDFNRVVTQFLADCKSAGKTKLVVDLQGNGGGELANGFNLFKSLFPQIDLFFPTSARATPILKFIIDNGGGPSFLNSAVDGNGNTLDYKALFGPKLVNNDNFTQTWSYNWTSLDFGFYLDGYGNNSNIPASPFTAENIIIVTDGICASTCTSFTGMANRLAGVRTIAFGGRPRNQPMQAMGGVKGGNSRSWQNVLNALGRASQASGGATPVGLNITAVSGPPPLLPTLTKDSPGLNFKNAHLNFSDYTPIQFVYEAANCRQFYTAQTATNITALWQTAANIAWRGGKCVSGSTVNSDGTLGSTALPYTPAVRGGNSLYIPGPGAINPNLTTTYATPTDNGTTTGTSTSSPSPSPSTKNGAESLKVSALGGIVIIAAIAMSL